MNLFKLLAAILLAVVCYAVFAVLSGWEALGSSLESFKWSSFGVALLLSTFNYGLRYLRWTYYLAQLDIRGIKTKDNLLIFLSGFVLTVTPGKLGEIFKCVVLSKLYDAPLNKTGPIVIAERLTDVIAITILVTIGSLRFPGGAIWASFGVLAVLTVLLLIAWQKPTDKLFAALEQTRFSFIASKLSESLKTLRQIAHPRLLLIPATICLIGWSAEAYGLHILIEGFGVASRADAAGFFYATSTLAGALVPVPGGLGVTEMVMQQQIIHLGGVSPAIATGSMILLRLATLWWAVALGFIALALLKLRFPKLNFSGNSE